MTNTKDITLEERIEAARKEVAMLCETEAGSANCAVAQDSLEELLAAKSHQQPVKNSSSSAKKIPMRLNAVFTKINL
jgi:CP12 domain